MSIKDTSVFKRLRQFMNKAIKGKMVDGVLAGFAAGDKINADNILLAKEQLFIMTAQESYLRNLLSGIGVTKPVGVGIDDQSFRELAIKQTNTKLVTNVFLDVLETFYGADSVKASAISSKPEGFKLEDGMTLIIHADKQEESLTVTFSASDFTNIANATADEICSVISRYAFNVGYPIIAVTEVDFVNDLKYVKIQSLTRGPNSSITVLGGSAQPIIKFLDLSGAESKAGTIYATSFSGQYVRFTWVGGPDPGLQFLSVDDKVNIFGSGILEANQGTFNVENCQGGSVNNAYFEIINPIFQSQGNIVCDPADTVSGDGEIKFTAEILNSPAGAVRSANIVTITTQANHNFAVGNNAKIQGVDNTTFWGTFPILSVTPTTFTYAQNGVDAVSGGGTATVAFAIDAEPVGAVRLNGTTTITTLQPHPFIVGQQIEVTQVRDSSFNGVFPITAVTANTIEYTQDFSNDITFFKSKRNTLQTLSRYATVYEVNPYEITVFLPVTTKVVRRGLIGSWHVHASNTDRNFPGSFIYSPKNELSIKNVGTKISEDLSPGEIKTVLQVQNASQFPDSEGYLMFNFGEPNQEGPVRYLSRPSSSSLLIDASYKFKKEHLTNSSVFLLQDTKPVKPNPDGTSRQAFLTGTSTGRIEAVKLIEKLKASGIFLNIVLVVPEGPGLHDMRYVYDLADTDVIY